MKGTERMNDDAQNGTVTGENTLGPSGHKKINSLEHTRWESRVRVRRTSPILPHLDEQDGLCSA